MKKIFLLFISLLSLKNYCQTNILNVGFETGSNISKLRGNEFIENYHSSRIGCCAGLSGQFNFKKIISIRTAITYELKGSTFEFPPTAFSGQTNETLRGKENFNFLTIPILIRATFGKKINYFINTGSYYSYLLRQTQFIETFQNSDEIKSNTTLYFKRNELGVSAGFGISYSPKMPIIISFELRNNLGLTNLSRLEVYNDGTVKTNSVSLLLGVCYKISKLVK
jgi:hypothetical protein